MEEDEEMTVMSDGENKNALNRCALIIIVTNNTVYSTVRIQFMY